MNIVKVDRRLLYPVLMGFFIMGFCDLIAPITNKISGEFAASRQTAVNFLPTMVFLWFLLLSTPVAALMNRIGRKRTALGGDLLTAVGLLVPWFAGEGSGLVWYFVGFGLLGIGNVAIQVAVNPLLATIVPGAKMTSYLTVGQIFRNTALMLLAPIVTLFTVWTGTWRMLLPIYALVTLAGGVWLAFTRVEEPVRVSASVGMIDCFRLLARPVVAVCAFGIAFFIAGDVGIGFLSSKLIDNPNSLLTTTGFYACRIVGTIVGAYVLVRVSDVKYLRWNMAAALALACALFFVHTEVAVYALVGVMGFTMACVFATFYAVATKAAADKVNEVAGLMILMISAGALSGPAIGAIIRAAGGEARYGLFYVVPCIAYLLWAAFYVQPEKR